MDIESEMKTCKVVLIGESGVGKTSIITRYVNDTMNENMLSTISSTYVSKTMQFTELNNQSLRYEIWDTAGQERFRSLTRIFYKNAAIVILVYSVPHPNSFTELKEYWYNQIKAHASPNTMGNKSDLISEEEEVDETEARQFAQEVGACFKLTSAKTGQGIDDLFKSVGVKFLNPEYIEGVDKDKQKEAESIKKISDAKYAPKKKCCD